MHVMEVGVVRIADDSDFSHLKQLVDNDAGWRLEFSKPDTEVWSKPVEECVFKMIKIRTKFSDVAAETLYDVLHDPDYRKVWDTHMLASEDIGCLNINNDVGYYAMSCPPPLKNRDFVLQRSWLDTGPEQMILNHSVYHKDYPPRKGFVRAVSHITGFVIRPLMTSGCQLGYVTQTDPQGALPPWLVNKVTHSLGPRMLKGLRKASLGYDEWKRGQPRPTFRPWHNPEQIECPRISVLDCVDTSFADMKAPFKASTMSLPETTKISKKKKDRHQKLVLSDNE